MAHNHFIAISYLTLLKAELIFMCLTGNELLSRSSFIRRLAWELLKHRIKKQLQITYLSADLCKTIQKKTH